MAGYHSPIAQQGSTPSLSLSFGLSAGDCHSPTSSIFSSDLDSNRDSMSSSGNAAVEDIYFSSNPPPKALEQHTTIAREFINYHAAANHRVVLVTSGGTTVPLEKQTVRFIDNFSAGTRGATSAEYFLAAGYAVIFLHRQFSLLPFSRHYTHSTDCFLDFLSKGPNGSVTAKPEHQQKMLDVLHKYTSARENNMLLFIPFVTITDYLFELRAIAQLMRPLGPSGLLYLAAAVSDFFLPPERMATHKIQSTDAADLLKPQRSDEEEVFDNFDSSPAVPRHKRLVVDLDPVPKFLKNLVDNWATQGMIISFKLETDPSLLLHKAHVALERYAHHLVIGNLLTTRKWEVVFVSADGGEKWIRVPMARRKKSVSGWENMVGAADSNFTKEEGATQPQAVEDGEENRPLDPTTLPAMEPELEIESLIIPAIEELHSKHIKKCEGKV